MLIWDHTRAGFRSFICALIVLAVLLILAYLTNPTEISFRAYLTEQSFRQHLSHLEDLTDDSALEFDCNLPRSRTHSSDRNTTVDRATLPFHFANRASVSLRTPKHVFHSFGICTIATTRGAAVPAGDRRATSSHNHPSQRSDLDGFVASDSWFIGAFGRWWRGGLVESWYYDAMIRSKDAQAWSSGILGFKALDKLHDYNGLPFAKFVPCPRPLLRGSPPKLRNRERSTQPSGGSITHRNSSPPPLPKSASLPLHADHRLHDFLPAAQQSSHLIADQKRMAVHAPPVAYTISRTSSTSGTSDHSPILAEVLKQIAAVQTSIHDLQNQFQEAQNTANQSHKSFEAELSDLRSRRREEDQRRVDGRARTKTLEEARRLAETSKREAEKKMKLACNAKDSAVRRAEELELEIQGLKERMEHDHAILAAEPSEADKEEEEELIRELERKRKEVLIADEVVVALNTRARELEEKIDESKSRLRAAQHRAQLTKAYLDSTDVSHSGVVSGGVVVQHCNYGQPDNPTWSSSYNPFDVPIDDVLASSKVSERVSGDTGSESREISRSPELLGLASVLRAQGYAAFDDDTSSTSLSLRSGHGQSGYFQPGQGISFSPFCDPTTPSAAFIPSSLISVLDSPSADLQGGFGIKNGPFTSSPVEYNGRSLEIESELESSDLHHAQGPSSSDQFSMRQNTIPYEIHGSDDTQEIARKGTGITPKGWFSAPRNEKQRSSLNPDAKVFRLTRPTSDKTGSADTSTPSVSTYDALNPTGLTPSITSSTPSSLLRAFAPSRAEREALQRALGGSTNTSLERLPSLSDVGSIPSSPAHIHAEASGRSIGEKDCVLPAWLQSLPLIRKPNFSPWEDEEPVSTEVKRK
ncbi:hypothetical protein L210DRAFT_930167 [Boletus edulis BED1]|uniref:Uncharacterized protein n=1 Tax=Boletus edulis BED1 TaxID=1328754 RepID=A0AAD4BZT2_BOLED|nr:hypothetical protein L210DRAFT_930167 [Boletus edulis BED1]